MAYENYEVDYPIEHEQESTGIGSERLAFIRRVYAHLAGAILAFAALEAILINTLSIEQVVGLLTAGTGKPWGLLVVFAAFIVGGALARAFARSDSPPHMQYIGLGLYVVLEAIVCLPLLYYAVYFLGEKGTGLIATAGILTLCVFAGLTITVFVTKKDFSGLAPVLAVGSMVALGVIVCAIIFGFTLGLFFSFAMVALLSGFILYNTSNVLHHYGTNQHVAAALELFADAATLFWYILRILIEISANNRN
jgi:FtsH-binding integral membrane protein